MKKLEMTVSLDELDLNPTTRAVIEMQGYSAFELITTARQENLLKLNGIWKERAEQITVAAIESGYMMTESEMSKRVRRLLVAAFKPVPETNEEYEARTEFTEWQKDALLELLDRLIPADAKALKLRFGLTEGDPMRLDEIGAAMHVCRERVRQYEQRGLRKLRHPTMQKELTKIFPGWAGFATATSGLYEAYRERIEQMPIEGLEHLNVAACRKLRAAKVNTVGELMQCTYHEVLLICGLYSQADSVVKALARINCSLKMET